ncbi:helix-turn-helix transcriptional regulator [Marinobacter sp.]|uniref:helix-turn-helix transcriptional regulator n=1 Tax=Marinobacter sp. TaxID=50741 RepID=UPI0035634A19
MKDLMSAAPKLLDDLYENTTRPEHWPVFLEKIANLFHADTATLRLTDLNDPVVHHSYSTGFNQTINEFYESEGVERDTFREAMASSPLGKAVESTAVISDREFENSAHYQTVFRPNGNFYAMGTQFERQNGQAMHIGIHRPRRRGHFCRQEQNILELFSPHLRRVTRLSHLFADLNQALGQAHHALDQLPFGVWHMDANLHIRWMNSTAEEALAGHTYGLGVRNNRLRAFSGSGSGALRAMTRSLIENLSLIETLKLGETGACLVMMQSRRSGTELHIGRSAAQGFLCFLLDAGRPAHLNHSQLTIMFQLTPAECRLASLLVSGLDVNEASALLQISRHTGRTQLKSIMRKTGVHHQAGLQRTLLLCADTLRSPDD